MAVTYVECNLCKPAHKNNSRKIARIIIEMPIKEKKSEDKVCAPGFAH